MLLSSSNLFQPLNLMLIQDGLGTLQSCSQINLSPTFKEQARLVPTVILNQATGRKLNSKVKPLLTRSKSWEEVTAARIDNMVIRYTPVIPFAAPGHKEPKMVGSNSIAQQAP